MPISAPPSARRATSYDVAQVAGVAQSTVSRCFREDGGISPATRERVLKTAKRLGYTPNALARSLITRRSNMVGVVITRYTLRGNPDVIYAIGESLAAAAKQLLLITVESDRPSSAALRGALEYPLDGLISCVLIADDDLDELLARRVPTVFFNRTPERRSARQRGGGPRSRRGRGGELIARRRPPAVSLPRRTRRRAGQP